MQGIAIKEIRIGSYNIRKGLGTDRRRNPDRILSVIAEMKCDIVVLQEADMRLGQRKTALPKQTILERTGLQPILASKNEVSLGWHGNAILARPSFNVTDLQLEELPGLEPRGAVIATLENEDFALRVVGVHLGLLRRYRRMQLSFLTAKLSSMASAATVIAGDFNERSQTVGLGRLYPEYEIHSIGKTFHARRPIVALDRFVTNGGATLIEADVYSEGHAKIASDHLPIRARIAIGGNLL